MCLWQQQQLLLWYTVDRPSIRDAVRQQDPIRLQSQDPGHFNHCCCCCSSTHVLPPHPHPKHTQGSTSTHRLQLAEPVCVSCACACCCHCGQLLCRTPHCINHRCKGVRQACTQVCNCLQGGDALKGVCKVYLGGGKGGGGARGEGGQGRGGEGGARGEGERGGEGGVSTVVGCTVASAFSPSHSSDHIAKLPPAVSL
jgi:hypothetical protein